MSAALLTVLAGWAAAGAALGWLYFRALWWTLRLFTINHPRLAWVALAGMARFAALGAALYLVSRQGALPLLAASLGLLAGRAVALRRLKRELAP